jgi:hypothetical protein
MKTIKKNVGIKATTGVKAGAIGFGMNHNGGGLKVKANIRAGILLAAKNHNTRLLASV